MRDSVFNLTALSERLFVEGRLERLAGKIQRAQELASLHADLMMALESLDALDALVTTPAAPGDFARAITEAALMSNAVVLYARATQTKSNERKDFDLRSRFSADENVVHQELADLRDKAIAHFGSGGSYLGEWQAELVVLEASVTGDARVGVATRRITLDKKLVARARVQIERACMLMREISRAKVDAVTDELNELASADIDLINKEIHQHPLNMPVFLTSPDADELARSNRGVAYIKGIVKHA